MRVRPAIASAAGAPLLAGLLQAVGAAQEPGTPVPPSFPAAVDVILVDAVVTDRQGRPVEGLAAEDFVVREDGVPQALTSFEAVALAPAEDDRPPTPAELRRSSANDAASAGPAGRVLVVVLDDAGLGLDGALSAREAAKRFLSEVARPGDVVSVVVPGTGLTWSSRLPEGRPSLVSVVESVEGLKAVSAELAGEWEARQVAEALDPLTQERMRVRLDAAGQLPRETRFPGESDEAYEDRNRILQAPFLRAESRRQLDRDRDRRRRLFGAVSAAVESVAAVKGRKSVLLFSEGFIQEPDDPPFRDLLATLRRANASIYYVDVRRPRSGAAADSRQPGDRSISTRQADPMESGGAEGVADETGGFVVRAAVALDAGFDRIARESSTYYVLGYSSTNTKRDGKYRRLAVEVRRPDLEVRARRGYYGPGDRPTRPGPGVDSDLDLEHALAGAVPEREVSLRLAAYVQEPVDATRVRVRLVGEVGLAPERFQKEPDGSLVATLDVAMALNHVRAAGRQRTPWREWRVRVPSPAQGTALWVPLEGTFDVPSGACQAKLAVRDRTSRALGTVIHELEVPDPGVWRVSTPVLGDVPGEGLNRPPRVRVDRSFVAGSRLYCYVEVYAGASAKATSPARASLAWALVDSLGKVSKEGAASPLTPGNEGRPARLETIPLSGLAPGEYELRLSVRDEASGTATEVREPIALRRPTRPDLAIYVDLLRTFLAGEVARASSGVMEWRPEDLARLAASLPADEPVLRRAALALHTALALRLWGNARALEAEAQIGIGRALLEKDSSSELHRDWLLGLGYSRLDAGSPLKALPFFEEGTRRFPGAAEAWLGAGICYELTAFPDGFAVAGVPAQDAARRAERCYREAARLDPRLAEARLRLGRVLARAGAHDEAEGELAAAEAVSPDASLTALARVFRGSLRDARGDLGGALRHYEAALAADPGCQTAAFALSEALHRSGDRRRAAASLIAALTASRSDAVSPWHAYHVGSDRWKALLATPEEPPSVSAGAEPPATP